MPNLLKSKYYVLLIVLFCARLNSLAQNWQIVGGGLSSSVGDMNIDSTTNSLYIGGKFKYADTMACDGMINWDGNYFNKFHSLKNTWNCNCYNSSSIIRWQNRLFMAGNDFPYNGRTEYLFEYVNNIWQPSCTMGINSNGIQSLRVINGNLFALGLFDSLCNQNIQSLAIFNGFDWNVFSPPSPIVYNPNISTPSYWLYTGEYFNGEYYFAGNFTNGAFKEIIRWTGTQWSSLQNGVRGGMAWVNSLKSYKGILYVGGYFYKSNGNAADCLMAWDGQNWFNPFPDFTFIDAVNDLEVINNELYISGNYVVPADNDSNMYVLARFDGCDLKVFGGSYKYPDYEKAPLCLAGLNGKIYAAVNDSFQHKSAKYLVSIPDTVSDIKTIHVSPCLNLVNELNEYNSIKIYPNPTSSILNINDEQNQFQNAIIKIENYLGQKVLSVPFSDQIDLSNFSAGMYFLTIQDKSNKKTVKIIKQ
jgi:hypothetical protein